jgi:hypothetical protein
MSRKETIRPGLEIDYDLLDADLIRAYVQGSYQWVDGPVPYAWYLDYVDKEGWDGEKDPEMRMMLRTLDNEQELAEGRRFLRLVRYKSYSDLDDLARRPATDPGEFVIRKHSSLARIRYVCDLVEADMPPGLRDPDSLEFADEYPGFKVCWAVEDAQKFTHADAIRLCVRVMETLGYDIPGDNGDYFEPIRADVAAELDARANRRPRSPEYLDAFAQDLNREP